MKRVLVSPLDWGLGHATRCIPVIRELQRQGCTVVIAGSGDSLALLIKEFPGLNYYTLPGYDPRYPLGGSMVLAMAAQLPHFTHVIRAEHEEINKIARNENVDLIISDNRYGCYSKIIPSVFITHQSNVMMPRRFGWLRYPVKRLNERFINRFYSCWIPDVPAAHSLAGNLIAFGTNNIKTKIQYIGWLSRFEGKADDTTPTIDVLAVLSGPEPQRTALENTIVPQLKASGLRYIVVRGLPSAKAHAADEGIIDFLSSTQLGDYIQNSAIVIARSGYSTVMDMNAMGKKVVFVPTPGQTEQEYLAKRLMEKGIAFSMHQHQFDLVTALGESKNYTGFKPSEKNNLLREAIRELIQ